MTFVGKVLVFVLTVGSLAVLGTCLWLYLDLQTLKDRQEQMNALKKEIQQKFEAQRREEEILGPLLAELVAGARGVDVPQAEPGQPFQLAPTKQIPVSQLKIELKKAEDDLTGPKGYAERVAGLLKQVHEMHDQLKAERGETELALKEQKRLREAIEQPKINNQPVKPFRDQIEEARQAKGAAEREQEAIRPNLTHALAELSILQQRFDQLTKRLAAMKVAAGSKGAGR